MISFELGNPQTIDELTQESFSLGKFVFKRSDSLFRLFMTDDSSHQNLIRNAGLLREGELPSSFIVGGGSFNYSDRKLLFSGSSSHYGQIPNSFLIACCRTVRIPNVDTYVFSLSPYFSDDIHLEERRSFWRNLGDFELDTERKEYVYDGNMRLVDVVSR
ncbi:MAG: hypothetical protein ACMXYE_05430 [Candidatus Woesearchaeota archaeon]